MPKSDWRKLEAIIVDLLNLEGIKITNNFGDTFIRTYSGQTLNVSAFASALADHVTLTLPEPIQVKS